MKFILWIFNLGSWIFHFQKLFFDKKCNEPIFIISCSYTFIRTSYFLKQCHGCCAAMPICLSGLRNEFTQLMGILLSDSLFETCPGWKEITSRGDLSLKTGCHENLKTWLPISNSGHLWWAILASEPLLLLAEAMVTSLTAPSAQSCFLSFPHQVLTPSEPSKL